ncbi:MAG TPA: hypothetical protein VGN14_04645 [Candidatus Elarobacter sp.]
MAAPAAAHPGVRVIAHGNCVVAGGIRTQSGAPVKAWDVWQEIFVTSWPTWLGAHTHHGAECIMNVYGVTGWWFAHGTTPDSPPSIVAVTFGKTVYTASGRVHTAGNVEARMQGYLGIHVLEQGSDFNYPVADPSAPPVAKSLPISVFKHEFANESPTAGTVTIENQIMEIAKGAHLRLAGSLSYYTFLGGAGTVTISGHAPQPIVAGTTYRVGRNEWIDAVLTTPAELVATEIVPGAHP